MSSLSLNSADSQSEDWDRSMSLSTDAAREETNQSRGNMTPRNSVVFPADESTTPGRSIEQPIQNRARMSEKGKRSLSELLKLHAEKGTHCQFTAEEAARLGDVLGQWINASSSPYEGEDDFFSRSQDDLLIAVKRSPIEGRPRGQSESANSRPPSSVGFAKSS
ncbi:hypothetical protein BDQ17DRAFT_1389510 [Cyathus striatus]|nr:hypothetical protein BDQ17DRAFT_1389510 [Cyathus striatus]